MILWTVIYWNSLNTKCALLYSHRCTWSCFYSDRFQGSLAAV